MIVGVGQRSNKQVGVEGGAEWFVVESRGS